MPLNASDFGGASAPKPWVSGATYAVGNVALSTVDFCYYVRKVAGAGATDPSSDTTNWQNTNGIKSIQRGTAAATASSVTITAVVMAKTELRCLGGYMKDNTGVVQGTMSFQLTSTTNIAVNGNGAYTGGGGGVWELTERF